MSSKISRIASALPAFETLVTVSPNGGCTDAIIQEIDGARMSIHVQAYSFTSARLAKALVDATKRGLIVRVLLDSSQRTAQYSSYTFFRNQNIPVYIDSKHAIAHNKVMVIDGRTVITGSFNFTKAAEERNAENLLIIKGKTALTGWLGCCLLWPIQIPEAKPVM